MLHDVPTAAEPRLNDCDHDKDGKKDEALGAKMLKARTILIAKGVDKELMEKVTSQLLVMSNEDSSKPITVYVNSPGGDADSGFAIYDMMRFVKAPVRTICAGISASAGVIIHLGGEKGQRYVTANSRFLIHQPSTYAQGQASDIRITAEQIVKIRERYNRIVADETGTPFDKVTADVDRDYWMNAEESVAYGLADKIITAQGELD